MLNTISCKHVVLFCVSLDCGIIASRLLVSLDDLLWVLTDSQLKAALSFVNSLKEIIRESNLQSKRHAADKLKVALFSRDSLLFMPLLAQSMRYSIIHTASSTAKRQRVLMYIKCSVLFAIRVNMVTAQM